MHNSQKASSVANLLNMAMAIVGGLWFPINTFQIGYRPFLKMPTYHLKQMSLDLGKDKGINYESLGFYLCIV